MSNQYSHPWKPDEIKWLKEKYPYLTKDEVIQWGKEHGRSYKAIINQASVYEIKKIKPRDRINETILQKKIQKANYFFNIQRKFLIKKAKIVIAGDSHYPFNNPKAEAELFQFLKEERPDIFVHCGDLIDFHEISDFRRTPNVPYSLKEEIEMGKEFFEKVRGILLKAKIFYIEGNHEFRWRKFLIDYAFIFYDFLSLKLPDLLELKKLKIDYIPLKPQANRFFHNFIQINDFYIGHFDKSLQNAGYTARWLRDTFSANVITGHVHRLGVSYKTYFNSVKLGAEVGCLCNLEPTYLSSPDWQNGFGELIIEKNKFQFFLFNILTN